MRNTEVGVYISFIFSDCLRYIDLQSFNPLGSDGVLGPGEV